MIHLPGLLLIGGAARNLGKTELSCKIIHHFSKDGGLIALKIKTLRAGEESFHGKDPFQKEGGSQIRIVEDTDSASTEDTGRMLRAGASRAFRIRCKEEALLSAFTQFLEQVTPADGKTPWIVCESNSLRSIARPGVFLMVAPDDPTLPWKPSAKKWKEQADLIILSNGKDLFSPDPLQHILRSDEGYPRFARNFESKVED